MLRTEKAALAAGLLLLSTGLAVAGPGFVSTNLKLRSGPGQNFDTITTMPAGTPVEVGPCETGWCQVVFGDQMGFSDARYLSFGQAPPPPRRRVAVAPPPGVVAVAPGPVMVPGPVVVPAPLYVRPYYYGRRYYVRRPWRYY
jgi:hypothetical protein